VGLERGPLSLVSTTEELLEIKGSGSGLEGREYDRSGSVRADYAALLYPKIVGTGSADKRRPLGRYSSLAHAGNGFFFFLVWFVTACRPGC
jgi:hypothetical protein